MAGLLGFAEGILQVMFIAEIGVVKVDVVGEESAPQMANSLDNSMTGREKRGGSVEGKGKRGRGRRVCRNEEG